MTQEHLVTPPPELVQQWRNDAPIVRDAGATREAWVATQAARWGADQELEACCEWIYKLMDRGLEWSMDLRTSRRPKPPSLKELALATLQKLSKDGYPCNYQDDKDWDIIRCALEKLDDSL